MLYTTRRFPKMTTQMHAPISASPPCSAQICTMFSLLVISEWKLPGYKTRSPSAGSGQLPTLTRFRECVPPWAVTSDPAPSLPRVYRASCFATLPKSTIYSETRALLLHAVCFLGFREPELARSCRWSIALVDCCTGGAGQTSIEECCSILRTKNPRR